MKKFTYFLSFGLLLACYLLASSMGLAQGLEDPLPVEGFLSMLFESLGGLKGAGALAIALAVVQVVMAFFRTKFAAFAGRWRLAVVYGMSIAVGILALMVSGLDIGAALLHANTLAAFQVFGHQIFKQLTKDE